MKNLTITAMLAIAIFMAYSYNDFCYGDIGTQEFMTGNKTWISTYCVLADHESIIWGN